MKKGRRGLNLADEAAACEAAVLAALANGAAWPTPLLQEVTGYGARYGMLLYRTLTRLAKWGLVEKTGPDGDSRVALWRWLPTEGNCDEQGEAGGLECAASFCLRSRAGCQGCRFWAYGNLTGPDGKRDLRWLS